MKLEICVTLDVNHLAFLGCVELNCYYSYYHHYYDLSLKEADFASFAVFVMTMSSQRL